MGKRRTALKELSRTLDSVHNKPESDASQAAELERLISLASEIQAKLVNLKAGLTLLVMRVEHFGS
jgi:hypothetical protein